MGGVVTSVWTCGGGVTVAAGVFGAGTRRSGARRRACWFRVRDVWAAGAADRAEAPAAPDVGAGAGALGLDV